MGEEGSKVILPVLHFYTCLELMTFPAYQKVVAFLLPGGPWSMEVPREVAARPWDEQLSPFAQDELNQLNITVRQAGAREDAGKHGNQTWGAA